MRWVSLLFICYCFGRCIEANREFLGSGTLHDNWEHLPNTNPHPVQPIKLIIAFQNRNVQWLKDTLFSVSDPFSLNYGKYPSASEIERQTGPSFEMLKRVTDWLSMVSLSPSLNDLSEAKKNRLSCHHKFNSTS
mmetsp:Transcript_33042/g.51219  ORF Transcript_33042/g.51219 Transcript_33042/m.51219 type:complete len:134 (-) Transcript_33042:497-898(-)